MIPVTGTVTLDGKPVDDVAVLFAPAAKGPAASGTTDAGGKFQLMTVNDPGAVPGEYNVRLVVTDSTGKATVKLKYADSLTGWKTTARAVTRNDLVGIANTTTRTQKPLMVRGLFCFAFPGGDIR